MPPTPPPADGERAGNLCIRLISCVLLITILGGGTFMVLYIALPETQATAWFPIAGMVLLGTPWAFWMMTCLYKSMPMWRAAAAADQVPVRAADTGTPAAAGEEATANSPGGVRRARSTTASMLGGAPYAPGKPEGKTLEAAADRGNGEGSSHASHDSMIPLFAMS